MRDEIGHWWIKDTSMCEYNKGRMILFGPLNAITDAIEMPWVQL